MTKKCAACGKETPLVLTGIGPILLCRDACYPDAYLDREAAQSQGEAFDVTLWARRRWRELNPPSTPRVQKRNKELDELAKELGFDGHQKMLTAWKNGEIKIEVIEQD